MRGVRDLHGGRCATGSRNPGYALVVVVLILAALLMLCTPFLLTARNADQASQQIFSRAQTRLGLGNAVTHARAQLERSHFSIDENRYYDTVEELRVENRFEKEFLDSRSTEGLMWEATARDLAGKIDLGSAPPQVIAAITDKVTRLIRPITEDDSEIPVASLTGLDPEGFIWLEGELIHYGKIEGNTLTDLDRGLGALYDADDKPLPGPRPPSGHGVGATTFDLRAFAPVEWRLLHGEVREFDTYDRLEEAKNFSLGERGFGRANLARLRRLGTIHGGVGADSRWQRAARMTAAANREIDGHISVDSVRWFNPGSTIQITDGESTELAIVLRVSNRGTIYLDRALANDYLPYTAEVRVLNRRPVNINTASAEVLEVIFENLKLRGRNERITGAEARALAELVMESRPFEGFEDFLRRLVLPSAGIESLPEDSDYVPDVFAAGGSVIGGWDAVALYRNALNANDFGLEYSTMPFCFASRDVYDLSLRAAVNAPSGVERYSAVRDTTEVIIPQEELTHVWARQEDFDSALRLGREAPFWATGPEATSRYDGPSTPPSRMWAHMGTWEGQVYVPGVIGRVPQDREEAPTPEHVFASREEYGFGQLFPSEVDDSADDELQGRVLHFRHETRDPEGRYLPDRTIRYPSTHQRVQWDPGTGLLRGLHFSMWIKPQAHADATILDVGGASLEADRLSIFFEAGDLVLRVLDGGGDHLDTPAFKEHAEVRYALGQGEESPGLPVDVWSHLEIDVRGTRPSQMMMLVNGLHHGVRHLGLTTLSTQIDESTSEIPVESTEGFPDRGVIRIGNELIEYVKSGDGFSAIFNETGPDAGFGGRNARVRWSGEDPSIPQNLGVTNLAHPEGAPVELYGFSSTLATDLPAGQAALPDELGPFRVAIVKELEGGLPTGDPIQVQGLFGPFIIGNGINGTNTQVTGLKLVPAESPDDPGMSGGDEVMTAFNPSGGYAALLQVYAGESVDGLRIGVWEVIRYSGWTDDTLQVAAWGDQVPELKNLAEDEDEAGARHAFVVEWIAETEEGPIQDMLRARLFVIPISIPVPGANTTGAFLEATSEEPQFAQITEPTAGELTEWVAYNTFETSHQQLVRDDPDAIRMARLAAIVEDEDIVPRDPTADGGGGGGGGGGSAPGSSAMVGSGADPGFASPPPPSPPASSAVPAGPTWEPILGEAEDLELPITRAVREAFQHRGVLGTFPHTHSAGTLVLPVFHTREISYDGGPGVDGGHPGKHDRVFLMGADFGHIGWPLTVHRGHWAAREGLWHPWQQVEGELVAQEGSQAIEITAVGWRYTNRTLCALDSRCPEPMMAGSVDPSNTTNIVDTRAITRMTLFPSGERPRTVSQVSVGGNYDGGGVPSAVVDEVVFGATDFGRAIPNADPESGQGGQLVLALDFYDGDETAQVWPTGLRIPLTTMLSTHPYLADIDQDAGLLRIGEEILGYEALDIQEGTITISEYGRGLLGTEPGNYERGTPVSFLDGHCVSVLAGSIDATDSVLPLASTAQFPREGLVLVGRELIHYTRVRQSALEMPRGSSEPGAMDRDGPGLFRGRYGTEPQAHQAGELVILFPMRYWDRWEERADAPELSYFGLELSQPAAFWRTFFWQDEDPGLEGVQLGILMRSDPEVPWDSDPELTEGLELFYTSMLDGGPLPIGVQSDRLQWRAFVEYGRGAFDVELGLAHGWRTTPRLTGLLVNYLGPSMTLRSVDR